MKKVLIIGGGFGGLNVAKHLGNSEFEITIVDKTNYHLFQPLLYQVATAELSPGDIAVPIRAIFRKYKNVKVIMDEAESIDKENKIVHLKELDLSFDYLVVATGSMHSYFGHDEWEKDAPGLKTLSDALEIREKILNALEQAEKIKDRNEKEKYLSFVIVGGGPTGVELAGAIAEIVKQSLIKEFRNFDESKTKVYLIEGMSKLLASYPDELSTRAKEDLQSMGVEVILNKMVTEVSSEDIKMGDDFIKTKNVIWAAGNTTSKLIKSLDTEIDKAGRAIVNHDMSIKGYPNIFVIGDAAGFIENGKYLQGVAQVAIQQGKYVAEIIKSGRDPISRNPFKYKDKGNMATIGRAKAVAEIKGFKLTGFFAWAAWSLIHVLFLIGFRNRFKVMAEWIWLYLTFKRGIRLIVNHKYEDKK
jgi:NADH dehydrogenase